MRGPRPLLLLLAFAAFVSLGLPDTVLGVAWPSLRHRFGLSQAAVGAVPASGMLGYVLSGVVAGGLIGRMGLGPLLVVSSGLVSLGLLGYAVAPRWSLFFPLAALIGLGSGAIDAGLNEYAARHFRVRHMNWLHAFWGVGASLGPAIMTAAIASGRGYRAGYGWLSLVLFLMALVFFASRQGWNEATATSSPARPTARALASLGLMRVWLHIGIFFLYTGLEALVGTWCFTVLREGRGLSVATAGTWTSMYWASLTAGRFVLGLLVERIGPDRLLRGTLLVALLAAGLFAACDGVAGHLGLVLLGASLAPIFPTLMARTPARLGETVARYAVGYQVSAATLGAAAFPAAMGFVVARLGVAAVGPAAVTLACALLLLHERLVRV